MAFPSLKTSNLSARRQTNALAITAIVVMVAITQLSSGAYGNDLASYPDEAAHFVSAVCVLDYLVLAPGSNPVRFAEAYYAHFPKVAFGHWPPGFFVEQAAWYAVFGASPSAGLLLVGVTAVFAGCVLFLTLRRYYGIWIAAISVAVYLSLPTIRSATTMLMPDLTVSLFAFMAVRALADGCVENRSRPWAECAGWSTALVLTKESGLLILVFAPLGFLLFGGAQRRSTRAAYFWGTLAVSCVATLAVYKGSGVVQMRGFPSMAALPPLRTRIAFLRAFVGSTSWVTLAVSAVGAAAAVAMRDVSLDRRVQLRCHALWVALWLVGQVAFRDIIEARYFLPMVPSLIVLFAAGIERIAAAVQTVVRGSANRAALRSAMTALMVGVCSMALMPSTGSPRRRGYAAAVDALASDPSPQAILISSDASGAGALIADLVARRRDEDVFAVRSDKVLATSGWMGDHLRLLASSTPQVLEVLDAIPVRYVILDAHASIQDGDRAPYRLLRQTILSRPDRFHMTASLPIVINGAAYADALQVFEFVGSSARSTGIRLPSSALVAAEPGAATGEWFPRSSSTVDREIAVAGFLDDGADRLAGILPLWPAASPLPPVRPSADRVGPAGASGELLVALGTHAKAESSEPWIRVTDAGGGARVVRYTVAENESARERTGFISIGIVRVRVSQDGRP